MICYRCQKECDHTLCLYCDGKQTAKHVYNRLRTEKSIFNDHYDYKHFNEARVIEHIKKQDILGLEGLKAEERAEFFSGYNFEWKKLTGEIAEAR